jgi:endonuclease/exonuclease/phosphatase family metal-dependent hydrolase
MRIKMISYNIHKGFSFRSRRFVLQRIKEILQLTNADIVFLQEVLGHHERHSQRVEGWPQTAQFEYLAEGIWPHFCYGKNAVYSKGHHGNAILSKFGFTAWDNIDISNNRYERRGLLHGIITLEALGRPLHLICLHLDLTETGRIQQVRRLCRRITEEIPPDAALIVAGDFNDWRRRAGEILEEELNLIEAYKHLHGTHARSFPAPFPLLQLDRIYCRGLTPLKAECLVGPPWNELSDHAALFAELRITKNNE